MNKKIWAGLATLLTIVMIVASVGYFVATPNVSAEAAAGACEDAYFTSVTGSADHVSFTAPAGSVIVAVCIKSGKNMFGGTKHSGPLGNGTYENGCYTVSGVGTETASIDRNFDSSSCQAISHGDAYIATIPPTLPPDTATPTYTLTFTPTATLENTPTNTPEDTPTNTPEDTATATLENTPTGTPEDTATPTLENTPTNTPEFTPTLTPVPTGTPDPCEEHPEQCVTVTLTVPSATATVHINVYIPVCKGCVGTNGNWWETPSGSPGWQNNQLEGDGPLGVEVAVVTDDCIVDHGRCNPNQFVHVLFDTSIGEVKFVDNGVEWDLGPAHTAFNGHSYVYYVGRVCDAFLDKDRTKCHSSNDYLVYLNGRLLKSFKYGGPDALLYNYWPCSLAPNVGMTYQKDGKWMLDWEPGFTGHDNMIWSMKMSFFNWPETWPDNPKPGHWDYHASPVKDALAWANGCQANGLFKPCELPNQ